MAPVIRRVTTKPYALPRGNDGRACALETDTATAVPAYAFHHDGGHFAAPEFFRPHRFPEQLTAAYMPYGAGRRSYVGESDTIIPSDRTRVRRFRFSGATRTRSCVRRRHNGSDGRPNVPSRTACKTRPRRQPARVQPTPGPLPVHYEIHSDCSRAIAPRRSITAPFAPVTDDVKPTASRVVFWKCGEKHSPRNYPAGYTREPMG